MRGPGRPGSTATQHTDQSKLESRRPCRLAVRHSRCQRPPCRLPGRSGLPVRPIESTGAQGAGAVLLESGLATSLSSPPKSRPLLIVNRAESRRKFRLVVGVDLLEVAEREIEKVTIQR